MPRDLPIGNGSLLINFDHTGQIRDIYWPFVGQENHTRGRVCRLGVWSEERFSWLDDNQWQRRLAYGNNTLVTESSLRNDEMAITLHLRDAVDFHEDLLIRQCTVENHADRPREIRLFFCHDLSIGGTTVGDSAYFAPEQRALFHYKGRHWFLISLIRGWPDHWQDGLDQWAVGIKDMRELEGSWRDAEDGELSGNPVAQGSIDSVAALHLQTGAGGQAMGWYVMCVGSCYDDVTRIHRNVLRKGPVVHLERTAAYWRLWATKEQESFERLPPELATLYHRSLLIVRTQIDNHGAILAGNDFDTAFFNRDTYSYMWPRDGALVAASLIDAGYSEITRRFFDFCHRVITRKGFLLHKYTPDGSLASSWHTWYADGQQQLPIQEDETALVLWALWRHFDRFRDIEFVKRHYRGLVVRAAQWICSYIDRDTGLPLPSWDLWEERHGIHAWTVASVWAGLQAAANFAEAFGENSYCLRYRKVAARMRTAAEDLFWDDHRQCHVRSLVVRDGSHEPDPVMDSSLVGLWYFGMLAADDPRVRLTMDRLRSALRVRTAIGGLARYEDDAYQRANDEPDQVPGNPWFICTLWLAQWYIATATTADELAPALELLSWAADHSLESGVMAEQVHPRTGEPLSVSPLTWSHSTYVATIRDYLHRATQLETQLNT